MVTKKGRFGLSKRDRLLGMLSANRLLPMDKGNALTKDGKIGDTLQSILEDLKPKAAYFADRESAR